MFVYHLRHEDLQAARTAAHQLLEYSPADAWTYRELANIDTQLGRLDDALAEAEQARQLQPNSPESYCVLGFVHATSGRRDEARQACREAIRRSVDNEYAMGLLMACCESAESQREELAFVATELAIQVILGDGLLAFRRHANGVLDPVKLLEVLEEGKKVRPDLFQTWSALMWQLAEMGRLEEATQVAEEATPPLPDGAIHLV